MTKLFEKETIDLFRLECLLDCLDDLVSVGGLTKTNTIAIISNLVDTDKEEADTEIERMVFKAIEKWN